jgi:hypothetical protein
MPNLKSTGLTSWAIRHIATFSAIALIAFANVNIEAQDQSHPPSSSGLADYVQRVWLTPVVDNIKRNTTDPTLVSLLQSVRLNSTMLPDERWGPNALAYVENGKRVVQIDCVFVLSLMNSADLAGLLLTGRDEVSQIIRQAEKSYAESVMKAIASGNDLPWWSIDLESVVKDQGLLLMAKAGSMEALNAAVTWTIFHEIAHHVLNHLTPSTMFATLKQKKKMENDADDWAFHQMERMGYGLEPLEVMLAVKATEEMILGKIGLSPPEISNFHPSFAERLAHIKTFPVDRPPRSNLLLVEDISTDSTGRYFENILLVPREADYETAIGCYYQFGKKLLLPYEHLPNGEICLYGREESSLSEIIIHDPESLKPGMTFRFTDMQTGKTSASFTRGFTLDSHYFVDAKNDFFWATFNTRPLDFLADAVRKVEQDSTRADQAIHLQSELFMEQKAALLAYAKGQIDSVELDKRRQIAMNKEESSLKDILGPDCYGEYRNLVLGSALMNNLLDQMLSNNTQ